MSSSCTPGTVVLSTYSGLGGSWNFLFSMEVVHHWPFTDLVVRRKRIGYKNRIEFT